MRRDHPFTANVGSRRRRVDHHGLAAVQRTQTAGHHGYRVHGGSAEPAHLRATEHRDDTTTGTNGDLSRRRISREGAWPLATPPPLPPISSNLLLSLFQQLLNAPSQSLT